MVNNIETLGLIINTISPNNNSININVNAQIEIEFNSDIDTSSVIGNITIFRDKNLSFSSDSPIESLFKNENYEITPGNISYENRKLKFVPRVPMIENSRYIIVINSNVSDIRSKSLNKTHIYNFFTESQASLSSPIIITPEFGVVVCDVPEIKWEPQNTDAYIFQISKQKTFEVVSYEKIIKSEKNGPPSNKIKLSHIIFEDGLYYLRVKSINGAWSEERQFFIKRSKKEQAVVSKEDISEDIIFDEEFEEELVVLDFFPKEEDISVSEKINIIYVKIQGEVKIDDINLDETYIVGELFEEEDIDEGIPHGFVESKFNVVYDSQNDESFVIFTLKEL